MKIATDASVRKSRNKEIASEDGGIGGQCNWPDDNMDFIDHLRMAGASADDDEKQRGTDAGLKLKKRKPSRLAICALSLWVRA